MDMKQKFIQKNDIVAPSSSASKTYQNRARWVESPIANVADELRSLPQKDCQCLAYTRAITRLNEWTTHYVKVKCFHYDFVHYSDLSWSVSIILHGVVKKNCSIIDSLNLRGAKECFCFCVTQLVFLGFIQ